MVSVQSSANNFEVLKSILSLIPHSVFWKDRNSVYRGCNERFLRDTGLARIEDVIGKTDFDMPWGKANAESYRKYDKDLMDSGSSIINIEEQQLQSDGSVVHVVTSKVPIFENGVVTGIFGIYMDITEMRTAQTVIQAQERQIALSAKMAALGQMAGAIGHEINTPLASIAALAETAHMNLDADELARNPEALNEVRESLVQIEETAHRIGKIVKGLKTFARNETGEKPTLHDLKSVLSETSDLCGERFRRDNVKLNFVLPEAAVQVNCRPTEISQVILNLLNNACDAVKDLDEKWVSVEVTEDEHNVRLSVIDCGSGIEVGIRDRIFQPFFTTKEKGVGTGLGLSVSSAIITSHGGRLIYDSRFKTTAFTIELPQAS